MVCGNFILPEACKPCLFLSSIQFAQLILPYRRNKINKAKKTSGFPTDRLEEMLAAFESFKKEALQRKQAVKKKTASPKEFSDWLLQQSNIIVELAECI